MRKEFKAYEEQKYHFFTSFFIITLTFSYDRYMI